MYYFIYSSGKVSTSFQVHTVILTKTLIMRETLSIPEPPLPGSSPWHPYFLPFHIFFFSPRCHCHVTPILPFIRTASQNGPSEVGRWGSDHRAQNKANTNRLWCWWSHRGYFSSRKVLWPINFYHWYSYLELLGSCNCWTKWDDIIQTFSNLLQKHHPNAKLLCQ